MANPEGGYQPSKSELRQAEATMDVTQSDASDQRELKRRLPREDLRKRTPEHFSFLLGRLSDRIAKIKELSETDLENEETLTKYTDELWRLEEEIKKFNNGISVARTNAERIREETK